MRAIETIQTFIRDASRATYGEVAIKSVTVSQEFADQLDYELVRMDMRQDPKLPVAGRTIMGVDIVVG